MSAARAQIVKGALVALGLGGFAYALSDHPLYGGGPGIGATQIGIAALGAVLLASAFLRMGRAANVLLLAITSLLLLFFAEVSGELVLGPRFRSIFQIDDHLVFKLIPNRTASMTRPAINGGQTIVHQINAQGFRGEDPRPPGDATRVVVYGDSFIHASYTAEEATFCGRLSHELGQALSRDVEVINAGVTSYGPDQSLLKLERELPQLKPDLVVVAIYAGNDYGDLMRNKMFKVGETAGLAKNAWSLDESIVREFDLGQRESIIKRVLANTLRAADGPRPGEEFDEQPNWLNLDFLIEESRREYQSFIVDGDSTVTNIRLDYYAADVSLTPNSESARYKVALMQAVLHRIAEVATEQKVPLMFVFIPHPSDLMETYDWGPVDLERYPDYHRRNQVEPLLHGARTASVAYVNLAEAFGGNDPSALYFRGGDDHWNDAGQKLAAEVAARSALTHGLLR